MLEALVPQSVPIGGGDINVHVNSTVADGGRLREMPTSFGLTQRVTEPTHRLGATLHVIINGRLHVPIVGPTSRSD